MQVDELSFELATDVINQSFQLLEWSPPKTSSQPASSGKRNIKETVAVGFTEPALEIKFVPV